MATIYHAPKPGYSGWDWFKFITVRIIFPPVLLWDLIKLGANKLLGEWVGTMVLPAQKGNFKYLAVRDKTVSNYNETDLICRKYEVITHDKAHLDTFEVTHKSQENMDPKYQKYIISFVGNGMCYEVIIAEMKEDAKALKANVVGFNLRGVGQSTGKAKSSGDLVIDGIAQVQRLLDLGVSSQNIMLKGHSLGAGVASLVAEHFHHLVQPINLFNGRSFSTITHLLVGKIRLKRNENGVLIGHKDSLEGRVQGCLAQPFIKFALALVKWEINAGSAFKSIPKANRDYIVVRSRKVLRGNRIDDALIPHYASIHEALTSERRMEKAKVNKEIANLERIIQKADSLAKSRLAGEKEFLIQIKEKIKSDRKMEIKSLYLDGHNSDLNSLCNRSGKSAEASFRDFFQRTEADHAVTNTP